MPKLNLPFLQKKKFVLMIGEDGAVLSLLVGDQVESRLFAATTSQGDRRSFHNLFTSHPGTPVYLVLDTMDQTLSRQSLPAVSMLSVGKLVKKRLERDFGDGDLSGAIPFGREESGRRDWLYMFVSASLPKMVQEWLDYVLSLSVQFSGIYLLPLEITPTIKQLLSDAIKEEEKRGVWQLFIAHNKTGGFRQIVLENGKVVFTRLVRSGKETLADALAGNLEQETLNTLEYLRRLSFSEDQEINIIGVVSTDLKQSLQESKQIIPNSTMHLYTPHEAAKVLGMEHVALPEDKFADLILAAGFVGHRRVLELFTPRTKRIHYFTAGYQWSFMAMLVLVPIFVIYTIVAGVGIYGVRSSIQAEEDKKVAIERRWKSAQNIGNYSIDEANKITDVVNLHKKLTDTSYSPLDVAKSMRDAIGQDAEAREFSWRFEYATANQGERVTSIFNLDFRNTGDNIEELFNNFDLFTGRIRNFFRDYTVDHSKLPDKITFDAKTKIINVQVSLSGPKKEDDANKR